LLKCVYQTHLLLCAFCFCPSPLTYGINSTDAVLVNMSQQT